MRLITKGYYVVSALTFSLAAQSVNALPNLNPTSVGKLEANTSAGVQTVYYNSDCQPYGYYAPYRSYYRNYGYYGRGYYRPYRRHYNHHHGYYHRRHYY